MRAAVLAALGLVACGPKAPPPGPAPAAPAAEAAASQVPAGAAPAEAAPTRLESPRPMFVWTAEKDGKRNHLVGTCHLAVPIETVLPPDTHATVLTEARVLLTELNLATNSLMDAAEVLLNGDHGLSLLGRSEPTHFWRLAQAAPDLPVPLIERLPAVLAYPILVGAGSSPERLGALVDGMPLDTQIITAAEANGQTTLRALETIEQQMAVLQQYEDAIVEEMADLGALQAAHDSQGEVLKACFSQDLGAMEAIVAEMEADVAGDLLTGRNQMWMPVLTEEFAQGGAVVAVGVAHMFGEQGLVSLLEAEGYAITGETTDVPTAPLPDVPWSQPLGIAEAPTLDPEKEAAWVAMLAPLGAPMCASPAMKTCLARDTPKCEATFAADVALCVRQLLPSLPDPAVVQADPSQMAPVMTKVGPCAAAGLAIDGAFDLPMDIPLCAEMRANMQNQGR